jgi:hypothetical protein
MQFKQGAVTIKSHNIAAYITMLFMAAFIFVCVVPNTACAVDTGKFTETFTKIKETVSSLADGPLGWLVFIGCIGCVIGGFLRSRPGLIIGGFAGAIIVGVAVSMADSFFG